LTPRALPAAPLIVCAAGKATPLWCGRSTQSLDARESSMQRQLLVALFTSAVASSAIASGIPGPTSFQSTYSFSCGSGLSGQLSYSRQMKADGARLFVALVNGQFIHNDKRIADALATRSIDSMEALCPDDGALIFLKTFTPSTQVSDSVSIWLDKAGAVTAVKIEPDSMMHD
jgi:hypothetical protein